MDATHRGSEGGGHGEEAPAHLLRHLFPREMRAGSGRLRFRPPRRPLGPPARPNPRLRRAAWVVPRRLGSAAPASANAKHLNIRKQAHAICEFSF